MKRVMLFLLLLSFSVVLISCGDDDDDIRFIVAILSGAEEVPPVQTAATGTANITVNLDTGAIAGNLTFSGLSSNALSAHIHKGAAGTNGPIIVTLEGGAGATSGTWIIPAGAVLSSADITSLRNEELYFNVHSVNNPNGEIRGQINVNRIILTTVLSGGQEVPPVVTNAAGTGNISVNPDTGAISGTVTFQNLSTNSMSAHIHQAAAGVNGPILITLTGGAGVTSGTWVVPAGTVLTAEQLNNLKADALYLNIHSVNFPGGEIRGQLNFP